MSDHVAASLGNGILSGASAWLSLMTREEDGKAAIRQINPTVLSRTITTIKAETEARDIQGQSLRTSSTGGTVKLFGPHEAKTAHLDHSMAFNPRLAVIP